MSISSIDSDMFITPPDGWSCATTPDSDEESAIDSTDELMWPIEVPLQGPRYIEITDSAVNRYFEYVMSPAEKRRLDHAYFTLGYNKLPSMGVNQALSLTGSSLEIGTMAYYYYWQRCRGRITNNWTVNIPLLYTLENDQALAVDALTLLQDSLSWGGSRPGDCVNGCGWNEGRRVQWYIEHDLQHAIAEDLLRSKFDFFATNGPEVDSTLAALVMNGLCFMLGVHRGTFRTFDGDNPYRFPEDFIVTHVDTMFPVPQVPLFDRLHGV